MSLPDTTLPDTALPDTALPDTTLPSNLLRPQPSDWSNDWHNGPFDCTTLECRPRLALQGLGAHISRIAPGHRSCPLHTHAFEEEVFYVLEGALTVRELEPDAAAYREYVLRPGEMVVYPPGTGLAHGFYNRSDCDAVFVGLSDDCPGEVATYPDSGKVLLRGVGQVGVFDDGHGGSIASATQAAKLRPVQTLPAGERPSHVVTDVPERDLGDAFGARLSVVGGARRVMVNRDRLAPGGQTAPLHWHTAEQELVLVLAGTPTLHQRSGAPGFSGGERTELVLQPGDLVHFGPNVPVAHRLSNQSEGDCLLLVVGKDDPTDVVVFPDEGRVFVRALGRSGRMTVTPYFEGEV